MNILKTWILAIASSAMLAACGGGGGDKGSPPFPGDPDGCTGTTCTAAESIDVVASAVQVGSAGDTITVSAIVKGSGNVGLSGAPITFSSTSGTISQPSATTDSNGVATATFSAGTADRANRTVTITAKSGKSTGTITVDVVGTSLAYSGATTIPVAGTANVSVKATDSKGAAIPNLAVSIASSLNNGLSATSLTTDSSGSASLMYTATNPGNDVLTFTGGGVSLVANLSISASQFTFVSPATNASVTVGTAQPVTVEYRISGTPQAGKVINFSTTAGSLTPSSATTNASGQATVTVSAVTAGPGTVQATVAGGLAQASIPLTFVSLPPAKLVLQVSPTAIGPNAAGSTNQQSQLRASVTDVNGNPVANATVAFTRLSDPSGGNLPTPSAVTDSGGQATVQYVAGAGTTANNGVRFQASVVGASPAVTGDATMTITQGALFIGLGTGNTISNLDEQTYKKDWVVYVTDSNGVAVANKDLTIKVLPVQYRKGVLVFAGGVWGFDASTGHVCQNEDNGGVDPTRAYNGILDPGEDFNGSGKLEPGNVVLVTTTQSTTAAASGIARTDSTGRATLTLLYAESYVPWVKVRLSAQATVSGTESSTAQEFWVVGAAPDFSSATISPAATTSPFGTGTCDVPD